MKDNDILVSTWGYEQTNVTFYQVIKATTKTATVRKIEQRRSDNSSAMTGICVPLRDRFVSDAMRRKILDFGSGEMVFITSYEIAKPWDGKLEGYTTYA